MSTLAMNTLVVAEHDGQVLNESVYRAITAAASLQAPVSVLLAGHAVAALAQQVATIQGVSQVLVAEDAALAHASAEQLAALVAGLAGDYQAILAAHSTWSRNFLPRVAALRDVAMISDVLAFAGERTYVRAIYAGNVLSTVQSQDALQVLTVHASKFAPAGVGQSAATITAVAVPAAAHAVRWVAEVKNSSDRPPLKAAKVVVSGGRSLGSAETFEQILSPLADKLNAALGATRAAVDAGYAPNDIQVGQTGVVVAPELYIAVGVSGAIQHTYGMKDSKIVVAINQDPDAPIFQVADYGLVADLFDAVPALAAAL